MSFFNRKLNLFATERTRAIYAGRAERENHQNYNGKPFRSKAQKAAARREAYQHKGAWVADTAYQNHPAPKEA